MYVKLQFLPVLQIISQQQQLKTYHSGRNIRTNPAGTWQAYPSWPVGFTSPRFTPAAQLYGYPHPGVRVTMETNSKSYNLKSY